MDKQKILQAGKIAKEVREWIKPQIKKGDSLLELAEKIESKIEELGAKPAFPVNLSINEIAAHYTPSHNDESKAHGLLKVDFGVHIEGWCADQAFSLDLENSSENKQLIEVAKQALKAAEKTIQFNTTTSQIGKSIQETIESNNFTPIVNLSGHEIGQYDLHAGLTIPNMENNSHETIQEGLYAIEPFVTLSSASGRVKDGPPSGIYQLTSTRNIRMPLAREVLDYITEKYDELPFCSRWIIKEFGTKALLALKQLEQAGNLHHFPQLIESTNAPVAQAENSYLVEKEKVTITTK